MKNLTLAIETSVKAGSLALLSDSSIIGSWTGNDDVSRSVDLLPQISRLFEDNSLAPKQLEKIAVSIGPGSFTGIRVGIATAKALALALNCPLIGISIFEALALENTRSANNTGAKKIMAVVSAGREVYFWQAFQGFSEISEPANGKLDLLRDDIEKYEITKILSESLAAQSLGDGGVSQFTDLQVVSRNYAELIGLAAALRTEQSSDLSPLYIRQAVVSRQ